MTPRQVFLIIVLGLLFLGMVLILIQRHMFREKYAILWLGSSILFILTPLFYDYFIEIGIFFGIMNPASFFFFFAIVEIFLLCIQFTVALTVSFNQRKITIQNLALLEQRVRDLESRVGLQGK
ncbi:MAG: DUF2304 domain-containing protein [Magnetococcales bacterium]|nr:DUF2304 domain-containing protein [Magnetococcales bacterium]